MKRIILYLILVLTTIYIGVMYDKSRAITLLAFELLLFAGMFLTGIYIKHHVSVSLTVKDLMVEKGETVPVVIHLRNTGIIPAPHIRMQVMFENGYSRAAEYEQLRYSINEKSHEKAEFCMVAKYCGRMLVSIHNPRVFDYLGIMGFRIPSNGSTMVSILPEIHDAVVEITERTRNFVVDGDEYDKERSGDDPSEVFQIREFRDGDTLQRVHWKMSAKADTLMTKEYSRPIGCTVLLLLDLQSGSKMNFDISQMDRYVEAAVSLSYNMMRERCVHSAVWYHERDGRLCRACIQGEDELHEMMSWLLTVFPYPEYYDLEAEYQAEYPGLYSTILRLDTNLKLWRNDVEVADFSKGSLQEQFAGLLLEV